MKDKRDGINKNSGVLCTFPPEVGMALVCPSGMRNRVHGVSLKECTLEGE